MENIEKEHIPLSWLLEYAKKWCGNDKDILTIQNILVEYYGKAGRGDMCYKIINELHQYQTDNVGGASDGKGRGQSGKRREYSNKEIKTAEENAMTYVLKLEDYISYQLDLEKYKTLWQQIFELPVVKDKIADCGKQKNTTFNRNMIANIIHVLMESRKVYKQSANCTNMAEALEGSSTHPVRAQLGYMPQDREIPKKIQTLITDLTKEK